MPGKLCEKLMLEKVPGKLREKLMLEKVPGKLRGKFMLEKVPGKLREKHNLNPFVICCLEISIGCIRCIKESGFQRLCRRRNLHESCLLQTNNVCVLGGHI